MPLPAASAAEMQSAISDALGGGGSWKATAQPLAFGQPYGTEDL